MAQQVPALGLQGPSLGSYDGPQLLLPSGFGRVGEQIGEWGDQRRVGGGAPALSRDAGELGDAFYMGAWAGLRSRVPQPLLGFPFRLRHQPLLYVVGVVLGVPDVQDRYDGELPHALPVGPHTGPSGGLCALDEMPFDRAMIANLAAGRLMSHSNEPGSAGPPP